MHQNQTKQQSFSIDVAVAFTGLERTCLFCKWQKKTASTSATSSATVRASARPTAAAAAVTTPRRPTIQRRSASRVSAPALAVPASWTSSCPAWRSSASNPTPARSPDICTLCPATSSKVGPLDFNYPFFWSTWVCLIFLFPWNAAYWKARDDLNIAFFCFISS